MCCLPTCAQGSSVSVAECVENGAFGGSWVLQGVLFAWEVPDVLVYSFMFTEPELRRCSFRWTRPLGGSGGIIIVAFWEFSGFLSNAPVGVRVVAMEGSVVIGSMVSSIGYRHMCWPK